MSTAHACSCSTSASKLRSASTALALAGTRMLRSQGGQVQLETSPSCAAISMTDSTCKGRPKQAGPSTKGLICSANNTCRFRCVSVSLSWGSSKSPSWTLAPSSFSLTAGRQGHYFARLGIVSQCQAPSCQAAEVPAGSLATSRALSVRRIASWQWVRDVLCLLFKIVQTNLACSAV